MHKTRTTARVFSALAAFSITGLAAVGLVGCSTSSASSAGGSATSGTVNWWGWSPTIDSAKAYIAAFNKVYPHIKVNFKLLDLTGVAATLRPALQSSDGPDVFDVTPGPELNLFGSFATDMTPAITKALGSGWKTKVAGTGIGNLTFKGKLAALSVGSTFGGTLWINQGLFDKYNVKPPKTLDQWVEECKIFKSHGVGCFVQGVGSLGFNQDTLQSISDQVDPGLWTKAALGQVKWTDPHFVKTLTIFKSLFSNGIMQPGAIGVQQYPDASNQFLSGKYAMIQMGTWYMQNATKAGMTSAISAAGVASPTPFTAVPILFPDLAGAGNGVGPLYGDSDYGLAVASKSKVKNAATTFAVWMTTSKTGQQLVANALNDIPALKGINPDWNSIELVDQSVQEPILSKIVAATSLVTEPREAPFNSDVQVAVGAAATTVAAGQATPEQAVQTLQAAAEKAGVKFK